MAQISTDRTINPSQLSWELGAAPLRVVDRGGAAEIDAPETDLATLEQAVAVHVADPGWTNPTPPPPSDGDLAASVLSDLEPLARQVRDGTASFDPDQLQQAVAALLLRDR